MCPIKCFFFCDWQHKYRIKYSTGNFSSLFRCWCYVWAVFLYFGLWFIFFSALRSEPFNATFYNCSLKNQQLPQQSDSRISTAHSRVDSLRLASLSTQLRYEAGLEHDKDQRWQVTGFSESTCQTEWRWLTDTAGLNRICKEDWDNLLLVHDWTEGFWQETTQHCSQIWHDSSQTILWKMWFIITIVWANLIINWSIILGGKSES